MKFYNYVMISFGLALLFEWAGIPVGSAMLSAIGLDGTTIGIKSSALYIAVTGIAIGTSILIGAITRTSPENYVLWPIVLIAFTMFIAPLISIGVLASNYGPWISKIAYFIIGMLIVGFLVSAWEHFRGSD